MGSAAIQGEFWGKAAKDWAELQEPMHKPLWEAMLNSAGVGQGTRFLDVGCGGGGASMLATGRGACVTALDLSEALLHIAHERVTNGYLGAGDIENLPFVQGAFDVVFAANSIQFASDPLIALAELHRVCAGNGRVVVGLFSTPDKVEFRAMIQTLRNLIPGPPSGKGAFALSPPGILEGLMQEVGMKIVDSGEVNCPFNYPNFEAFWQANASAGPTQRVLQTRGEAPLKAAVRIAVEPFQDGEGNIRMNNQFRYVTGGH